MCLNAVYCMNSLTSVAETLALLEEHPLRLEVPSFETFREQVRM